MFLSSGYAESAAQAVTAEDIPDISIKEIVQNIVNTSEDEDFDSLNKEDAVSTVKAESGVSAAFITRNNAAQVAYDIMVFQVVHKCLQELEELRKGLEFLKVANLLENHPKVARLVFSTVDEATIDPKVLLRRIRKTDVPEESDAIKIAHQFFCDYIKEVCARSQGVDIKTVLAFITASKCMPVSITVSFLNADGKQNSLPDPDTCTSNIRIPTCYSSYEKFKEIFDSTVSIQGKGYARA
ncbi:hypothetical protein AWC38_SpisGene21016 [Stylophora pistillata]|uniref:HECT domain-containing protein n=1 Tax=Stylophora pistillata TaxID=50429 RepID=A0A2B4RDB1_STYPI|nr:hypothetical protein AWC38_SpisGene21016 [Stylophora pistillata]